MTGRDELNPPVVGMRKWNGLHRRLSMTWGKNSTGQDRKLLKQYIWVLFMGYRHIQGRQSGSHGWFSPV